jgi:hypothetical protein
MEAEGDKPSESAGNSGSPVAGEKAQAEVNGHTTAAKSGWKAKREEWIKPEDSSKQAESSLINPSNETHSANDRGPHIVLDEEHVNVTQVNGEVRVDSHNTERKKSLPPIKVPDKSAEIPVIVSRAVYNRYVMIAQNERFWFKNGAPC